MARKPAKSHSKHPYQFELVELIFGQIVGMHPDLEDLAALSSNLEYLLDSVREVVSPDYFLQLLQMHPLAIVKDTGKYYCISNQRLFQIAKIVLPDSQLLSFREMMNPGPKSIADFGQADFYLCHLLFSLRSHDAGDQMCRAWLELDDVKKVIAPEVKQLNTLATILGVDRRTAYLRRKKRPKKLENPATRKNNITKAISTLEQGDTHDTIEFVEQDKHFKEASTPAINFSGDQSEE